ncbi:MAG: OPT/YSL family transporter [Eggerthella lenta]
MVLLAFVATAMSAQSVGQTGIDPMEIFGLIVLLAVAAVSSVPQVQLFFVAGIVAVACGLAGDVMNDFHAGHVLGTSPKAQWIGQAIGAVLGALVAVAVMAILASAAARVVRHHGRSCPRRRPSWPPWCRASPRCRRSPSGLRRDSSSTC